MTSPFSTLFLQLQVRLSTQVPALKFIDQELGQLENYGDRPPVSWPCCLIDFDGFAFEDAGQAIQFAEGEIILRLGFPPFSNTSGATPLLWKEKALAYYDIEWAIYKALHGWKPEHYGYVLRVAAATERREDNIRVRVLRYKVSFEDYNASPVYQKENPSEDIEFTAQWETS